MYCKIVKDIVGCPEMFGGGIENIIYLYPKEESVVLHDDELLITKINGPIIKVQGSKWTYGQSVENDNYRHSLQGEIVLDAIEDLHNGQNTDYIVVYKEKNGEYKCFGDTFGAKLSFKQDLDSDKNIITVKFDSLEPTPVSVVDETNFLPSTPDIPFYIAVGDFCQTGNTGYKIISYIAKVNNSGDPLDRDNVKCSVSHKKQAAYKHSSVDDIYFDIIGTYSDDSVVEGITVKTYDAKTCPNSITGTIFVTPYEVNMDTTSNKQVQLQVESIDGGWSILNSNEITTFSVSNVSGPAGISTVTLFDAKGGQETLQFINNNSGEIVTVDVNSYIITVEPNYSIGGSIRVYSIPFSANGDVTVTSNMSEDDVIVSVKEGVIYLTFKHTFYDSANLMLTITHNDWNDEEKQVEVFISGSTTTEPNWVIVEQHCEISNDLETSEFSISNDLETSEFSISNDLETSEFSISNDLETSEFSISNDLETSEFSIE